MDDQSFYQWRGVGTLEHGLELQAGESAFNRLNPEFAAVADQLDPAGRQAVRDRELALALGIRVTVATWRENGEASGWW
jgi:hypothetical protein